jgi:hypothetical protein
VPSSRRRVGVAVGLASNAAVALLALSLALGGCGSADVKPNPAAPQGADPVAWVGAFCGGLGEVIAGAAASAKSQPIPQGQKDGLLRVADTTQQAFINTAHKLTQLGQPGITNGKQVQDTTVGFFTTAAAMVGDRRTKLAALDANDPNFVQKSNTLTGSDLGATATPLQALTSNKELAPAFGAAPECQRLGTTAANR